MEFSSASPTLSKQAEYVSGDNSCVGGIGAQFDVELSCGELKLSVIFNFSLFTMFLFKGKKPVLRKPETA